MGAPTAYDLVLNQADRSPDALAIRDDRTDRQFTYRALIAELDAIAAGFAARGIGPGDRVATCLPNILEHGLALLALARLGAVPAPINPRLDAADIGRLVADGAMKGAFVAADPAIVQAAAGALPAGAPLFVPGAANGPAEDFAACRAGTADLPPRPALDREDPAILFYTSGTTGLPKGVVLAQRTTEPRILWLATQGGMRHGPHTRALGFMPLAHAIGYYGVFLATLAFGGSYQVMSAFDPAAAVDLIERHGLTYTFAAPTLYHALVRAPNYAPAKMRSLRLVLYGGSSIPEDLIAHMDRHWEQAEIRHIYGTTETMCSAYNPAPAGDRLALRPGYYTRLRVVAPGGGPDDIVGPGEEGELLVAADADTIFTGYLNRPDATAEKMRDGWVRVGDLATLDERGWFTLRGRVDDMIRSGGESIHPGEVEAVLQSAPGVGDCAAIGLPDDRWGEIVVGCIVGREDGVAGTAGAAALDAHVRASRLAGFMRPKAYYFCTEIPRNPGNGNILRRLLREAAAAAGREEAAGWQPLGAGRRTEP